MPTKASKNRVWALIGPVVWKIVRLGIVLILILALVVLGGKLAWEEIEARKDKSVASAPAAPDQQPAEQKKSKADPDVEEVEALRAKIIELETAKAPSLTEEKVEEMLKKIREETPDEKAMRESESARFKALEERLDKMSKAEQAKSVELENEAKKQAAAEEETEFAARQVTDEVLDSSKNFRPEARFTVKEEQLKARIKGWQQVDGWSFPIMENNRGLPTPVKGETPPEFLAPRGMEWAERPIRLENPKGGGSYTTTGWAVKGKPGDKPQAKTRG